MMNTISLFILIQMCMQQSWAAASNKQHVVGLISTCKGTVGMGVKTSQIIENYLLKLESIVFYEEIDVCEDEEFLIKTLLDLTLDRSRYMKDNLTFNINSIFTYIPERLFRKTVAFLQFTNIKLFPLTKTSDDHWLQQQKNVFPIYHTKRITEGAITRLVNHFQLKYIVIYEILTNLQPQLHINQLRKYFGKVHIRYFAIHLERVNENGDAMKTIYDELKTDIQLKAVVLIGNQVGTFMKNAYSHGVKKFWILFSNFKAKKTNIEIAVFSAYKMTSAILNIPRYDNKTFCSKMYFQNTATTANNRIKSRLANEQTKLFRRAKKECARLERTIESIIQDSFSLLVLMGNGVEPKRNFIRQYSKGNETKVSLINDLILPPNLQRNRRRDKAVNISSRVPNCRSVIIQKIKTQKENQELLLFTKQIDFYCKRCNFPYYKDGAGGCTPCPKDTIPFQNQSNCYDSRISEISYDIVDVLDGIGAFLCLFILVVYFTYRHTPVVRSSHLFLSTAQVTCCLALFISFRLFSIAEPSQWLCTTRQTTTSLLLVAAVSIVVCKAEQFLTICNSKTLIGKKKKRDLLIKQTLIFLFIVLTDSIVIVLSFPFPSDPKTATIYSDINNNKYTFTYCPIDKMSILQVIYCIFILLLSIVQALRGHNKLPDAYNDGNAIITSSATSACCLLFSMFYIAQEGVKRNFLSIINISLSISLLTLLLSLYGMKIYVILFQPNKNTKSYIKTYTKSMEYVKAYMQEREDSAKAKRGKKTLVVQDSFSSSSYQL